MIETLLTWIGSNVIALINAAGYFGVFVLMAAESANLPIPSEFIMPFSGSLIATGRFDFWILVLVGTLGNVFGSIVSYLVAKFGGRPFLDKYGKYILLSQHHLKEADKWFEKYGMGAVFFGRMLPIIRTFISFPAGLSSVPLWSFTWITFVGAFPFVLALTYVGKFLGDNWESIRVYFHYADVVVAVSIVIGLILWLLHNKRHKK